MELHFIDTLRKHIDGIDMSGEHIDLKFLAAEGLVEQIRAGRESLCINRPPLALLGNAA